MKNSHSEGYWAGLGRVPPACLSSLCARLSGGARSSGCLPSGFLREPSAPWSSRTDTSSGLDRRAAMCSGESPDTLLFTVAPARRADTDDLLTLQSSWQSVKAFLLQQSTEPQRVLLLTQIKDSGTFLEFTRVIFTCVLPKYFLFTLFLLLFTTFNCQIGELYTRCIFNLLHLMLLQWWREYSGNLVKIYEYQKNVSSVLELKWLIVLYYCSGHVFCT